MVLWRKLLIGILGIKMRNLWIFAKVLATKPYILNVIRHKTSYEVKVVQPHM